MNDAPPYEFADIIRARYGDADAVSLYQLLCRALVGDVANSDWEALGPADWLRWANIASHEGTAGLLWLASDRGKWRAHIPTEAAVLLRGEMLRASIQNQLMLAELERLLAGLSERGVQTQILKGAALALTLYDKPGLRPMGDLDLLIRPEQTAIASETLIQLGLAPEMSRLRRWLIGPLLHELNFDGGKHISVHAELHWDLIGSATSRYQADMPWFWEHSLPIHVGKAPTRILAPGAMLLHLAAHLALKHGEERALLRWFYDLHLLIERHGAALDWEEVSAKAAALQWGAALRLALISVQARFGTSLPPGLFERLAATETQTDTAYLAGRSQKGHLGRALGLWRIHGWRGRLALLASLPFWRPQPRQRAQPKKTQAGHQQIEATN